MLDIYDPSCRRCGLSKLPRKLGRAVCIPGTGPENADILFYGEAPGEEEELHEPYGAPFVGSAGRELNALFDLADLPRKKVFVSNPVRCRPPGNRKPDKDETAACLFYTVRELELIQPKVIVALGGAAIKALTGLEAVGANRGKMLNLLPQYRSDVPVIATYHPAAYLHNPGNRQAYTKAIVEDMRLAKKISSGSGAVAKIVTAYNEPADIKAALRKLSTAKRLACDLEWEVLPEKKNSSKGMWPWSTRSGKTPRPISIALSARIDGKLLACSVPFDSEWAGAFRKIIARRGIYFHNAMADCIWLWSMGWKFRLEGCTYVLSTLLGFDSSYSLEALASILTDMPSGWKQESGGLHFPRSDAEWQRKLEYNAKDTVADVLLLEVLERKVVEDGREQVMKLYRHVLVPAIAALSRSSLEGTPIDQELLRRVGRNLRKKITRLTEQAGDLLGISGPYEGIVGTDKVGPYIEKVTGITFPRQPKKGGISVTNDLLGQVRKKHKAIPKVIAVRKLEKWEGSYVKPWDWLLTQQRDRRLHTVIRLAIARTGRTSAESEAGNTFQQFPRNGRFRELVEADEGYEIQAVDQSQIELRAIAWKSRDRRMLDFFARGDDLHEAMAGFMKALGAGWTLERYLKNMQQWRKTVTSEERYGAKPINFGLSFAGGPNVVKKTARNDYGIIFSDEQARLGYEAYHLFYPDVKPWQESHWKYVEQGWVPTDTGRIRLLVFEEHEDFEGRLRKAINTPIQNFASDLSLFCLVYTWELLFNEYSNYAFEVVKSTDFFHDAMISHVKASESKAVLEITRQAWEHPPLDRLDIAFDVPLKADIKVGKRWVS
jgi:uracil-DNA glycosylase family 4